ncbi:glycosyl hydrolase [Xanthobacteraceae bacterium A53D]
MRRFLLAAGILAGLLLGGPWPARAADLIWGATGHPLVSYSGVSIETQLDLVHSLGMGSYRVDVYRPGELERLSKIVEAGKLRGVEILPVLIPLVDYAQQSEAELYAAGYDLAHLYVSALGTQVAVWELGNEAEIYALIRPCEMRDDGTKYPCEWGIAGGVGVLDYYGPRYVKVAAMLRGLSEGARAANPTVRRAMGTAGWGHLGFFERIKADGIAWDITVWHMYGGDPEKALKVLAKYGKPIWITELNHPLGSQKGEQAQADGLKEQMIRLRQLQEPYGIEAAHIYELLDEPYWEPSYEAYMGLVNLRRNPPDGWAVDKKKPAYFAVKEVIADKAAGRQKVGLNGEVAGTKQVPSSAAAGGAGAGANRQ